MLRVAAIASTVSVLVALMGHTTASAPTTEEAAVSEESLPVDELECTRLLQSTVDLVQLQPQAAPMRYEHPPWLNQCQSIYLDLGSNIGVQVRKLYEPEKYPGAPVLPLFERQFGSPEERRTDGKASGLCALGFEPHPGRADTLNALQSDFQEKGYLVHFYPYAIADSDGTAQFEVSNDLIFNDWGANITALVMTPPVQTTSANISVPRIDLYRFLQELPRASMVKLMKMDIEGSEWDTLARLLPESALCKERIEEAFIEVHPDMGVVKHWVGDRSYEALLGKLKQQECMAGPTAMLEIDDETYMDGEHFGMGAAYGKANRRRTP